MAPTKPSLGVGAIVTVRTVARLRGTVIGNRHGRVVVELAYGERLYARHADVERVKLTRAATAQRRALGLGPDEPFEYHLGDGRALTDDERRFAEDRQILEAVAMSEPDNTSSPRAATG